MKFSTEVRERLRINQTFGMNIVFSAFRTNLLDFYVHQEVAVLVLLLC